MVWSFHVLRVYYYILVKQPRKVQVVVGKVVGVPREFLPGSYSACSPAAILAFPALGRGQGPTLMDLQFLCFVQHPERGVRIARHRHTLYIYSGGTPYLAIVWYLACSLRGRPCTLL